MKRLLFIIAVCVAGCGLDVEDSTLGHVNAIETLEEYGAPIGSEMENPFGVPERAIPGPSVDELPYLPGGEDGLATVRIAADEMQNPFGDNADAAAAGGVCACASTECIETWVRQAVGCDVCVVIECEAGPRHACALCEALEAVE